MTGRLFLTGFMGTGKSSVGVVVAQRTGLRYFDLDRIIVEKTGMSVTDIFNRHGESFFRRLETEALEQTLCEPGIVVATGGGAVIAPGNRNMMRRAGYIVNLSAPPEVIRARVEASDERPLLKNRKTVAEIAKMLEAREPFYSDADIRIDTDGKNIEDVAAEIVSFFEEKQQLGTR